MKPTIDIRYDKIGAFISLFVTFFIYAVLICIIYLYGFDDIIIGMLAVLSISFIYFIIKKFIPALNRNVIVEITSNGIIDNLSNRRFYWEDIDSVKYRAGYRTSGIIILNVQNPKNYYAPTFVGAFRYWFNKSFRGCPIFIQTRLLNMEPTDILDKISEYSD